MEEKKIIDISRPHTRAIWRSKWWVGSTDDSNTLVGIYARHHTYVKPVKGDEVKGKRNKRLAKRLKVKAMKAVA